jgi:hypothetical protein
VILSDHLVQALRAQTFGERSPASQSIGTLRIEEVHRIPYDLSE